MANKVYAVRKGKAQGIFYTWEDCKSSTDGYSGAEYKSFESEVDAKSYLNNSDTSQNVNTMLDQNIDGIVAYIDGSYSEDLQKYAFGCLILTPKGEIVKESGCDNKPDGIAVRNVAGELLGALHVVRWAICRGYNKMDSFLEELIK